MFPNIHFYIILVIRKKLVSDIKYYGIINLSYVYNLKNIKYILYYVFFIV